MARGPSFVAGKVGYQTMEQVSRYWQAVLVAILDLKSLYQITFLAAWD
jgi:hypothetical protein